MLAVQSWSLACWRRCAKDAWFTLFMVFAPLISAALAGGGETPPALPPEKPDRLLMIDHACEGRIRMPAPLRKELESAGWTRISYVKWQELSPAILRQVRGVCYQSSVRRASALRGASVSARCPLARRAFGRAEIEERRQSDRPGGDRQGDAVGQFRVGRTAGRRAGVRQRPRRIRRHGELQRFRAGIGQRSWRENLRNLYDQGLAGLPQRSTDVLSEHAALDFGPRQRAGRHRAKAGRRQAGQAIDRLEAAPRRDRAANDLQHRHKLAGGIRDQGEIARPGLHGLARGFRRAEALRLRKPQGRLPPPFHRDFPGLARVHLSKHRRQPRVRLQRFAATAVGHADRPHRQTDEGNFARRNEALHGTPLYLQPARLREHRRLVEFLAKSLSLIRCPQRRFDGSGHAGGGKDP